MLSRNDIFTSQGERIRTPCTLETNNETRRDIQATRVYNKVQFLNFVLSSALGQMIHCPATQQRMTEEKSLIVTVIAKQAPDLVLSLHQGGEICFDLVLCYKFKSSIKIFILSLHLLKNSVVLSVGTCSVLTFDKHCTLK